MSLAEYLRPFTNAFEQMEQLAHLHSIGHTILNKLNTMEENMATQADIDAFATQLNSFGDDLSTKVKALEDQIASGVKSEDLDLSGLRDAVSKIGDLDASTSLPASDAPAAASTDAPVAEASTPVDAPATDSSAPDDASTPVEVPTEAPAPAAVATATDDSATADSSASAVDASAPVSGANATPGA